MDSLCNCPCWVSSNVINSQVHFEDKDTGPLLPVTVCTGFFSSRGSLRPTHQAVHSDSMILPFPPPGPSPVRTETSNPLSISDPLHPFPQAWLVYITAPGSALATLPDPLTWGQLPSGQ